MRSQIQHFVGEMLLTWTWLGPRLQTQGSAGSSCNACGGPAPGAEDDGAHGPFGAYGPGRCWAVLDGICRVFRVLLKQYASNINIVTGFE